MQKIDSLHTHTRIRDYKLKRTQHTIGTKKTKYLKIRNMQTLFEGTLTHS